MIADLVKEIPEADFDIASDDSQGQVEIIGWLYQYYNQEPHHEVVDINGGPVKERDIPAATQLFTTDWVVRYMVDNSLGRYYLEHTPDSQLADQLKYLLPGELHPVGTPLDLSALRILDNAMGSGHILVYAFDVLMKIYDEQGYSRREAARQIATQNLYGLEIDKRAYQLAYFAIMMKVRQYDRRALSRDLNLNLFVFEDAKNLSDEFLGHLGLSENDLSTITEIRDSFIDAKTLGSIIHFEHTFDTRSLFEQLNELSNGTNNLFVDERNLAQLRRLLQIVDIMQAKYDVVVTNPPYLNKMDKTLKTYVKKHYKDYSGDLFSVFIWLNINMTVKNGYAAYMTPMVWMFIKTFEKLRTALLANFYIPSLIQMETHAFFDEAFVTIDSFVLQNRRSSDDTGSYIRLTEFTGGMKVQEDRVLEAIDNPDVSYFYSSNQTNFAKIPGSPVVYWAPQSTLDVFSSRKTIRDVGNAKKGLDTGNNALFYRHWFEININKSKWIPLNKGGNFRKWYGNRDYVINWEDNGRAIKSSGRANIRNERFYFIESITWTDLTSGQFGARFSPSGSIFDASGPSYFGNNIIPMLAYMNSKVFNYLASLTMPTMHYTNGQVALLPYREPLQYINTVSDIANQCINIAKDDWDSSMASSDFQKSPLVIAEHTLALLNKLRPRCAIVPILCQFIIYIKQRSVDTYGKLSKTRQCLAIRNLLQRFRRKVQEAKKIWF
ncbi:BREX-1 system adenine-specific DNA-methyltransferase PglX [Lacticaseibacillus sp. GG6-2]